jgi:hypothetical protein
MNSMTLSQMFGSVLESPFPSPNLMEAISKLPVSTPSNFPLISFGDPQSFFNSVRSNYHFQIIIRSNYCFQIIFFSLNIML